MKTRRLPFCHRGSDPRRYVFYHRASSDADQADRIGKELLKGIYESTGVALN